MKCEPKPEVFVWFCHRVIAVTERFLFKNKHASWDIVKGGGGARAGLCHGSSANSERQKCEEKKLLLAVEAAVDVS